MAINPVSDISYTQQIPVYASITVTTTATTLAALLLAATPAVTIPPWALCVWFVAEDSTLIAVRWRADGTAPTASIGEPIFGNTKDPCLLGHSTIVATSLISATGSPVTTSVRIGG